VIILGVKHGHDGAIAAIVDRTLSCLLEPEKDSNPRHSTLTPATMLHAAELLGALPDVVAVGGWHRLWPHDTQEIGAGYFGHEAASLASSQFFGKQIRVFSSSHERSHIMMAVGMAPPTDSDEQVILVWEGDVGSFYVANQRGRITRRIDVISYPGARYALLYALADPCFPEGAMFPRLEDAGKLMALAAYGDAMTTDCGARKTVDDILALDSVYPVPKRRFRESPLYNAGVESRGVVDAAAVLTDRLFRMFEVAAEQHLPSGVPLRISGGCGLNCDWNSRWRAHGQFASVFVPPCTDDSGSALGTAIDALGAITGDPTIAWNVYVGLNFDVDTVPSPDRWEDTALDLAQLAQALLEGRVVAWVQGRWEAGPRALGHRSLLAAPFQASMKTRLNCIKHREQFRPIAPCCRIEDMEKCFEPGFADPYMLYFQRVRFAALEAVTHVDGSARVQSVTPSENPHLHALLCAVAAQSGVGVLCNTSLNLKGRGFINRMSDLCLFAERANIDDLVVGDRWFRRRVPSG
jgi:hydroxymethyl cephem carbamoyltransferase